MDLIYLSQLKIPTTIGIYEWERRIKQTLCIDLEMATDIRKSALSDSVDDTINYKLVAKRIIAFVESSQFQLIETLAEKIAEIILTEFHTAWVRVKLAKPGAINGARDVGVIIERGSRQ